MATDRHISNQLKHLLDFAVAFDQFQDGKLIYSQLNDFLRQALVARPLIVFSKPKGVTKRLAKDAPNLCRIVFNRYSYEAAYEKKEVDEVLVRICGDKSIKETWKLYRLEKEGVPFVAFYCGLSERQLFFGIFSPGMDVETLFMENLVRLMVTVSRGLDRMRRLKKLEDLVHIDDVTGLYNQRKLLEDLGSAIVRHKELKEKFAVLFIDVDYFKKVNDGYGHLVGTQLLTEIALLLRKTLRESDLVYRYGGDEFVMIVPDVCSDMAQKIGERVLNAVKVNDFELRDKDVFDGSDIFKLTVSIGVAEFPKDARTRDGILGIADRMMYEAKKRGRGQVCYARDILNSVEFLK